MNPQLLSPDEAEKLKGVSGRGGLPGKGGKAGHGGKGGKTIDDKGNYVPSEAKYDGPDGGEGGNGAPGTPGIPGEVYVNGLYIG